MTSIVSRLYGLTVASPFPLPGATAIASPGDAPDVTLSWEPESAWRDIARPMAVPPGAPEDRPRIGETVDGHLCVEWRRELQLVINPSNDRVAVICRPAKLEFAPTVLVGIGMGLLLHRRGILCLHGSVVSIKGRSFALLGASGAGKSTTAAALVAHGATLISDDLAVLRSTGDGFLVERGCTNVRLHEAAKQHILGAELELATAPWIDKLLWDASTARPIATAAADAPRRLDAIYLLGISEDADGVSIGRRLAPLQALRELVDAWYPQGFTSLLTQARLGDLQAVATRVPLFPLRYPRRWTILPQLVAALAR